MVGGLRATGGLGAHSHLGFGFATDFLEKSLPLLGSHLLKEGQAGQGVLLGPFQCRHSKMTDFLLWYGEACLLVSMLVQPTLTGQQQAPEPQTCWEW